MHKLSMKHPTTVKINGVEIPINWDYRYALAADEILNSTRLKRPENNTEKINRLLFTMYAIDIEYDEAESEEIKTLKMQAFLEYFAEEVATTPENRDEAIMQIMLFLNCGDKINFDKKTQPRTIDYNQDATLFKAAFKKGGIDLNKIDYLHWWDFVYGALELLGDTKISRLAYLRQKWYTGKQLTKEELQEKESYGEAFFIKSDEQKESELFWNAKLPD